MASSVRSRLIGVTRVDEARLAWWCAFRALLVYQVFVTALLLTDHPTMALPVASGIVMVALADAGEDVGRRWRTMLWATLWITLATFAGGLVSHVLVLAVALAMLIALAAGVAGIIGPRAGVIGIGALVLFIIFNGTPASDRSAVAQALGVAVGGIAMTVVTVVPHVVARHSWLAAGTPVAGIRARLAGRLDARNVFVRHGVRLAIVIGIAMLVAGVNHEPHAYWLPMTVAWMTKPDQNGTDERIVQRVLGTIAGILVAALIVDVLHAGPLAIVVVAGVGMALSVLFMQANYPVAVIGVTVMVVSLLTFDGDPVGQTMAFRIILTVAAGVLAFLAFYVWPPARDR